MDFLGKWRVFWFQWLFRMCLPIRDLRLPGRVCCLSLLICYHCSFYFHGLMLVVLWEWKLSLLNGIWKEYKVTTGSDKIFTFSLARIWFPDSLFFPGFGQIELLNVAWVSLEPGDAGWKACTRSYVKVDYVHTPDTSIFIRLSHLYQECHGHFIVIRNEEEMGMG